MQHTILRAGAGTDPGRRRENNEDAFLCDPEEGVFAVIDGVGGYAGGEVASAEARDVIQRRLHHQTGTPEERLREAVTNANNKIYWRSQDEPMLQGMACVLTVTLLDDDHLFIAHVGDTRLYKIRGRHIQKLTRDHSFVGMREDRKELSEYEAMHHPRRNEILRDVGSELHEPDDEHFIDIVEAPFEPDCALLLCSDGLTDLVPSRDLLHLVHEHAGDPSATVAALIRAANEAGGTDNITVIVVEGPQFGALPPNASPGRDTMATGLPPRPSSEPPTTPLPPPTATPADRTTPSAPAYSAPATPPAADPPPSPLRYYLYGLATALVLIGTAYTAWILWNTRPILPPKTPANNTPAFSGSITEMLAQAQPGATVTVPPGTYRETVRLRSDVILRSAQPGAARLLPPVDPAPGDTVAVRAEGITGAALIGFTIGPDTTAGAAMDSFAVGILARDAALLVDSTTITGTTRYGVYLDAGMPEPRDVVVQNSDISNNAGAGLVAHGAYSNLRIIGNTIRSNAGTGVILHDTRLDLHDNTISGNGETGIVLHLDSTLARLRRTNTFSGADAGTPVDDVRILVPESHLP